MLHFPFRDLTPFQGRSASIKRPREITHFSFDDQHTPWPLDDRSLRYYYPPFFDVPGSPQPKPINLSQGFDSFIKYDDNNVNLHLNPLLDTIVAHEEQSKARLAADIVTWRGMMTKILAAPFDKFGDFSMNATCFEGTIYIEENQIAKAAQQGNERYRGGKAAETMQYWGYKFETLATLPRPWAECSRDEIEDRQSEVVNNHAQYCSIVRTGIGRHTIVIGGEVDGVEGCKPDDPTEQIPYVELKTHADFSPQDHKTQLKFERKMCRFWAQSFLLGVPKIIVGFRSENGFLLRLQEWKTMDIPNFVKQSTGAWDGNICINFASAFLDWLREYIASEGTWTIERRHGAQEITLCKTSDEYDKDIVCSKFRQHREVFQFDDP